MTVNIEGIITEDNSSLEHQKTLYNYGNVLTEFFEKIALTRGRVLTPKKWYEESDKIIKDYTSYDE
jgi:hypothetical protein